MTEIPLSEAIFHISFYEVCISILFFQSIFVAFIVMFFYLTLFTVYISILAVIT